MDVNEFALMFNDANIQDAIYKADKHFKNHKKIAVSISGGSDSDIMFDMFSILDRENKAVYLFMNTGLEYDATKRHIKELESKYNIKIQEIKATKPIPTACKEYGLPFLSKTVSEMISRLQKHGFKWENEPLEILEKRYPHCRRALRWWCNDFEVKDGKQSKFNIAYNTWLKEFMIECPPTFIISPECCHWAKKDALIRYISENDFDLSCVGIRKAEGGARSSAYHSCYTETIFGEADVYRPLFWFDKKSKQCYKKTRNVRYSDCYEIWGLIRTGCSCCPFGQNFEEELTAAQEYEPLLYRAAWAIFGPSYEYTRKYREFQKSMKERGKNGDQ
jgi:3'-phosphoadenosine 5'-phosphosulfate sulfotransferase (PAPS reductase)/FAD synthetase